MGYERTIVQRLFESRGLAEASFQSGGSTYKCAFGKYYKDGEEINRDEYFKAKETEGSGGTASAPKSMSDVLTGFEKHGDYGYSSKNATQDDVDRVSDYLKSTGFEQTDSDNSEGDWRKFTDKEGNEVEVTFDGGYMEVNGHPKSKTEPNSEPVNPTPSDVPAPTKSADVRKVPEREKNKAGKIVLRTKHDGVRTLSKSGAKTLDNIHQLFDTSDEQVSITPDGSAMINLGKFKSKEEASEGFSKALELMKSRDSGLEIGELIKSPHFNNYKANISSNGTQFRVSYEEDLLDGSYDMVIRTDKIANPQKWSNYR